MKKKIIIFVSCLIFLGAFAFFYINKFILPAKLKSIVVEKTQETTGRRTSVGTVDFSFLKGFVVRDFVIFEKDSPQTPFISIPQLSFRVLYLPLLREQKIIVPSVTLTGPQIIAVRRQENSWNFSDIVEKIQTAKPVKSSFNIIVGGLLINNAKVSFIDQALSPEFTETIENINLKIKLALPQHIKFSCSAAIAGAPSSSLSLQGTYQFSNKKLSSTLRAQNIALTKYVKTYLPLSNLSVENAVFLSAEVALTMQNNKIEIKSKAQLADAKVTISPNYALAGNPSVDFNLEYNPNSENKLNYDGTLDLAGCALSGLPYVDTVKIIKGKLFFEPDKLKTDALSASVLETNVSLSGALTNFKEPHLEARLEAADIDLEKINAFLPAELMTVRKIKLSGKSSAALEYSGALPPSADSKINATAELFDAAASCANPALELSAITGKIRYAPEQISLENISGNFSQTGFTLDGAVTNFKNPLLDVRASLSRGPIEKILQTAPELSSAIREKIKWEELTGFISLKLNYKGPAASFDNTKLRLTADLEEAALKLEQLPDTITGIAGKFDYSPNEITWKNLKGTFRDTVYVLNGKLNDLSSPVVETTLASDNLKLKTKLRVSENSIDILTLDGNYFDVNFNTSGNVRLSESTAPFVSLTGNIAFNLSHLAQMIPQMKDKLEPLNPVGAINLNGSFKGPVDDWKNWQMILDAQSPDISLSGYHLKNVSLKLDQQNRSINQLSLLANFYDGELKANLRANLKNATAPFQIESSLTNTDLAKLKSDTIWKNQNISGALSASFLANGDLLKLEGVEGEGSVAITDGNLWQLNLFKGLGKYIFVPEFENITFHEAGGDFTIRNQRLSTSRFALISQPVTLEAAGWMDFDGNLNFDVVTEFSEEMLAQSDSIKKAITAILTQGDSYLTIKITGSLKEPKYSMSSTGVLRKTRNLLFDSLKSIFEE